jgi:signal transduction histidine kinase
MTDPSNRPSLEPPDISTERTRVLLTIATGISHSLDPQEVAETALWLAIEAVNLKMGLVLLLEEDGPTILASHGVPADWLPVFQVVLRDRGGTFIDQCLEADVPKAFSNLGSVPDDPVIRRFRALELESLVCLPLRAPGNTPGTMLLASPEARKFQTADLELLQAITDQVSTGLRNAWLFSQSWRQLEELESVAETARAVVSSLDLEQILARIMQEATAQLDTEAAALLLLDPVKQELEYAAVNGFWLSRLKGTRLPVGQGIPGQVAQNGETLLVPDVSQEHQILPHLDEETRAFVRSILCVPLRVRERLIGVVEVINKRHGGFSSTDQRFLESLATFAAVAIENARFYEEAIRQTQQSILYAQDLSAAHQRERKQREALDRLRYSFLNVVGHEFKTPLTVILQGLEVLREPKIGPLNPDQAETVAMLERQSRYLARLVDGLVTFAAFSARQGAMQFRQVPFSDVLDDALMLSQFKATRKNIQLEDRRQTSLPTLSLDKEHLSEAIAHLIDNAIKFSPDGCPVTVEAGIQDNELDVRVIDRGPGIPADQLEGIWDSFVQMNTTLRRGLEGLGLGLAIARYIVEAHNGRIFVESELGKGSTFTVRLPCPAASSSERT